MTKWAVEFHEAFLPEFEAFAPPVQDELAAMVELLAVFGPHLKRPGADTLNGSDYANMKELRFEADRGVWRVAYAFDPERKAILLVAGDKAGVARKRFYRTLISRADERFSDHLKALAERKKR
jgi:hypothetical protein